MLAKKNFTNSSSKFWNCSKQFAWHPGKHQISFLGPRSLLATWTEGQTGLDSLPEKSMIPSPSPRSVLSPKGDPDGFP